jgi:hypothetical protein
MTEPAASVGRDDPVPEPTVEREETPDGRYVLYFSWPGEPPDGAPGETSTTDE